MATVIRSQGKKYKLEDIRPFYLYDGLDITSADTEKYYFQTPENKTIVQTNLKQFSAIQIGWVFDVKKIRLIPNPDVSVADLELLAKDSVVTYLKEGDIEIFSLPSIMLNSGCGLSGSVSTTVTATSQDIVSLGHPAQTAVHNLPFPLTITGGRTFQFRQKWTSLSGLSATTRLYLVLEGILRRDVVGA